MSAEGLVKDIKALDDSLVADHPILAIKQTELNEEKSDSRPSILYTLFILPQQTAAQAVYEQGMERWQLDMKFTAEGLSVSNT